MPLIENQTITNREAIERHTKNRDALLSLGESVNQAHAALSTSHQNNLAAIEERSEDTTRMRVCNARKRKYDFEMELSRNWHWMWSTFYFNKKHYGYIKALFKVSGKFFSSILKIFKAFREDSGIIGYNKKLIFLTISNVV